MNKRTRALLWVVVLAAVISECAFAACPDLIVAPSYMVGSDPVEPATADFDGNGTIDIVVTNLGSYNVSVLLGYGDGLFAPAVNYAVPYSPSSIVAADFTSDGVPDLAVITGYVGSLLVGLGDGTFAAPSSFDIGTAPQDMRTADMNGDGNRDLVVADAEFGNSPSRISVILGNGSGVFSAPISYTLPSRPAFVAIADYNGDSVPDAAVARSTAAVSVLIGNGDGTFSALIPVSDVWSGRLTSADFNGDGTADLALSDASISSIHVLLGNGDGTFGAGLTFRAGSLTNSIGTGDFNGDGIPDLSATDSRRLFILLGHGDGTFASPLTFTDFSGLHATGDFNGDGHPDLALANELFDNLSILINRGDGTFMAARTFQIGEPRNTGCCPEPDPLVEGDFNHDGASDLVAGHPEINGVSVLIGNGDGTFAPVVHYAAGASPKSIVVADFNADGEDDLAVADYAYFGSSAVWVLLGNGDGTFVAAPPHLMPPGAWSLAAGDFNADSKTDLIVALRDLHVVSLLLGNGDGSFVDGFSYPAGEEPIAVVAADFNSDGKSDAAFCDVHDTSVSVRLGRGDGTLGSPAVYELDGYPHSMLAQDFDGDGIIDLGIGTSSRFMILLGRADGTFGLGPQTNFPITSRSIAFADMDGDGSTDVVAGSDSDNNVIVVLSDGAGGWLGLIGYPVANGSGVVVIADFNDDERSDIATTNYLTNDVSIVLNRSAPTPAPVITTPATVAAYATLTASVVNHAGSLYLWSLDGGEITAGWGTSTIQYTAGPAGTLMTLSVVERPAAGCDSDPSSVTIAVDFIDVPPSHPFHDYVIRLLRSRITGGCGGGYYCPAALVSRQAMAVFVVRGEHGADFVPPTPIHIFADPPPWGEDFIEQLYNEGITGGCATNPLRFCPFDVVLRSQLAIFLLRAEHGSAYAPAPATGIFADVPVGSFGANFIEQLYAEGITGGCATNPLRYCPNDSVSRGAMAVFLTRVFNLP